MPTWRDLATAAAALLLGAVPAAAATCRDLSHDGRAYALCEVSAGEDLRLWLNDAEARPLGTFDRLRDAVTATGGKLGFAMNAGMYHPDRAPVGLYIEEGRTLRDLVRAPGPGNFGLQPNGVFCITASGFRVVETLAFDARPPECRYATQSGPMLVIDGQLHPRFLAESDSRNVRNGVGVSADGATAFFAISDEPVTFHEFARLFRDALAVPNALYFDGNVSRLYAPDLGRDDLGLPMGPMVGLVLPAD